MVPIKRVLMKYLITFLAIIVSGLLLILLFLFQESPAHAASYVDYPNVMDHTTIRKDADRVIPEHKVEVKEYNLKEIQDDKTNLVALAGPKIVVPVILKVDPEKIAMQEKINNLEKEINRLNAPVYESSLTDWPVDK